VQLIIGSDFTAIGQPLTPDVSAPAATPTAKPRTAADTSCIN